MCTPAQQAGKVFNCQQIQLADFPVSGSFVSKFIQQISSVSSLVFLSRQQIFLLAGLSSRHPIHRYEHELASACPLMTSPCYGH